MLLVCQYGLVCLEMRGIPRTCVHVCMCVCVCECACVCVHILRVCLHASLFLNTYYESALSMMITSIPFSIVKNLTLRCIYRYTKLAIKVLQSFPQINVLRTNTFLFVKKETQQKYYTSQQSHCNHNHHTSNNHNSRWIARACLKKKLYIDCNTYI